MGQLDGRVAIVTGAGLGIGQAIARRFVEEGARVVVAELNAETGRATADQLGASAHFVQTNAAKKESVEAMVAAAIAKWGTLDILVNNAWGGGRIGRIEKKTPELMEHGLAMGFLGPFWAMCAAHPILKAKGYGRIINICSLNGVNAHMGTAEYNVGKEALRTLTRSAAREWAPYGICANVLCPGAATSSYRQFRAMQPEMADAIAAANPMRRMGDPDRDIAGVALFLASDDACYLTGNTLYVDGGGHINGVAWAPELPE